MSDTGKIIALAKAVGARPDPDDVKQNVEDWLDDHPEATTTVQDGSITRAKLASGLEGDLKAVEDGLTAAEQNIGVKNGVTFTVISGKYINQLGTEQSSGPFSRSTAIPVNKGDIIEFTATGYLNAVSMIAVTDENETAFTPAVKSVDSNEHTFTYQCAADGYVVVSYNNTKAHNLKILTDKSNEALKGRAVSLEWAADEADTVHKSISFDVITDKTAPTLAQQGIYINSYGTISESGNFNLFAPIELTEGQTIVFNAIGYNKNVAVLAIAVTNGTYIPVFVPDGATDKTYAYTATSDVSVVISSNKVVSVKYGVYKSDVSTNTARIDRLEKAYADVFCFTSIGVLGDSLASGASNYPKPGGDTTPNDRKEYSWGKFIEREHGIPVALYSQGGTDTKTWLTRDECFGVFNADTAKDCYIIGLGVNDAYLYGADYLGTEDDVHVGNESENANTYNGNYSKIISVIKTKSPYAKIFCLTNPKADSELKEQYNQAVADVAGMYDNVYLIDLFGDEFFASDQFTRYWNGAHSTAIGYKAIAEHLWERLNVYIRENYTEFLGVQWILFEP